MSNKIKEESLNLGLLPNNIDVRFAFRVLVVDLGLAATMME